MCRLHGSPFGCLDLLQIISFVKMHGACAEEKGLYRNRSSSVMVFAICPGDFLCATITVSVQRPMTKACNVHVHSIKPCQTTSSEIPTFVYHPEQPILHRDDGIVKGTTTTSYYHLSFWIRNTHTQTHTHTAATYNRMSEKRNCLQIMQTLYLGCHPSTTTTLLTQ